MGPSGRITHVIGYIGYIALFGTGICRFCIWVELLIQRRLCPIFVRNVGSPDIHECFRGLTGSQRTPGFGASQTQPVELVQYNQEKLILTKYIANVPMIINYITMTLPQTYLVPSISLCPFILGLNFVHSLQGGITMQNNKVSFHPKTTTIAYTNIENRTNNIVLHFTNKIEEIKDSIVNDYSKNLKNALKLKKPFNSSRKNRNYRRRPSKTLE